MSTALNATARPYSRLLRPSTNASTHVNRSPAIETPNVPARQSGPMQTSATSSDTSRTVSGNITTEPSVQYSTPSSISNYAEPSSLSKDSLPLSTQQSEIGNLDDNIRDELDSERGTRRSFKLARIFGLLVIVGAAGYLGYSFVPKGKIQSLIGSAEKFTKIATP